MYNYIEKRLYNKPWMHSNVGGAVINIKLFWKKTLQ